MDLRTFKDQLEKLGSQNNHLAVMVHGENVIGVRVNEDLEVDVQTSTDDIANSSDHKVNADGIPVFAQRHAIPEDQIGRTSTAVGTSGDPGKIVSTKEPPDIITNETPVVVDTPNNLESNRPLVVNSPGNDPLFGLTEVK